MKKNNQNISKKLAVKKETLTKLTSKNLSSLKGGIEIIAVVPPAIRTQTDTRM